ncbi:MAG: RnfABCDGE type electron transport complex subunit B [Bacteroidales bacterium]|jgi:Na+-translocating ferredoxin:NAD+ oxidoreductase RNF subunit RnfB|nr:RnfABCDGE type electron transport complex subunit B [Bacteroidales bacterium]
MNIILFTILTLALIGTVSAVILYVTAQKFKVYEDPRIDTVLATLPAANCGGCGFAGCRNFAESLVKADDISLLFCPVGGNTVMAAVAQALGKSVEAKDPLVAVVRCGGSPEHRPRTSIYDGSSSCAIEHALYNGDTGCPYGCLGCGDCATACAFNALSIHPLTGLPVVNDANCTACGACVKACPRNIIELRRKDRKDRKIFVSCINRDKGGIAKKYCGTACIGCSKCVKVCTFDAIKIENNLAFIDAGKCKMCRKCPPECPTGAILEINFPLRKNIPSPEKEAAAEIPVS